MYNNILDEYVANETDPEMLMNIAKIKEDAKKKIKRINKMKSKEVDKEIERVLIIDKEYIK